jgi:hypothetical protein
VFIIFLAENNISESAENLLRVQETHGRPCLTGPTLITVLISLRRSIGITASIRNSVPCYLGHNVVCAS